MNLRNAVFGVAAVFGIAVWSWCRPCTTQVQAQGAEAVHSTDEAGVGTGGTRDEAAARYRANQSRHWRQVAMGSHGSCP
jgi:hypothetical protein